MPTCRKPCVSASSELRSYLLAAREELLSRDRDG
jgi:hypothetical protein